MTISSAERAEEEASPLGGAASPGSSPHPSSARPSRWRSAANLLYYIYVSLRTCVLNAWIRFNRWLYQSFALATIGGGVANDDDCSSHSLVVIGDGLAFGSGDGGVALGSSGAGVGPHLEAMAVREPSVRTRWTVLNCGEARSTSDKWLPPPEGNNARSPPTGDGKKGLFERVFGPGKIGNKAEIVLIMVGTSDVVFAGAGGHAGSNNTADGGLPPEAMRRKLDDSSMPYPISEIAPLAKNVGTIASALQMQGRSVCVVDLPAAGVPGVSRDVLRRLNRQIGQVLTEANEAAQRHMQQCKAGRKDLKDGTIVPPIRIFSLGSDHALMRPEYRSFNLLYLNRKGYKQLALGLFEDAAGGVKEMMVGVEWRVWRKHLLAGSTSSPKKNN